MITEFDLLARPGFEDLELEMMVDCAMPTRDELFDDANGDFAIGELESAVEKYRACVALDPEFFDGWHALGMALMKIGRFPEAIEAGKKATELQPNDQIGWTSLSLFYNRNGDIKEAEAAGTKSQNTELGRENRAGIGVTALRRYPRANARDLTKLQRTLARSFAALRMTRRGEVGERVESLGFGILEAAIAGTGPALQIVSLQCNSRSTDTISSSSTSGRSRRARRRADAG